MSKSQTSALKTENSSHSTENWVDDQHKKAETLIEREQIAGTPFLSVKYGERYFLMLGQYRLNEIELKSHNEVLEYLDNQHWNLIPKVIVITLNETIEQAKKQSSSQQNQNQNGN